MGKHFTDIFKAFSKSKCSTEMPLNVLGNLKDNHRKARKLLHLLAEFFESLYLHYYTYSKIGCIKSFLVYLEKGLIILWATVNEKVHVKKYLYVIKLFLDINNDFLHQCSCSRDLKLEKRQHRTTPFDRQFQT